MEKILVSIGPVGDWWVISLIEMDAWGDRTALLKCKNCGIWAKLHGLHGLLPMDKEFKESLSPEDFMITVHYDKWTE